MPTVESASALATKIESRTAVVAVIGLGFAGFPQAVEIAKSGFRVMGVDVDANKIVQISAGESLSPDVPSAELQGLQARGHFSCSTDYAVVSEADIIVACLPTPLDPSHQPDLRYVVGAAEGLRGKVRAGQLLLLESTVPPGTTRKLFAPVLEEAGLVLGQDAFLAFAPERIDPGNKQFPLQKIPRLVGGITPACTQVAGRFYSMFVDHVSPVSSPEVAEMSKNVENTFRFINISFINEVAMLCDRMGISIWEVVKAASTKPFAFMPHYPGAGVGGHCIPIVPFYLKSVAGEYGVSAGIIDAARVVNDRMPHFVVEKMERELARRDVSLKGARVLVLGVTYKPDVPDLRESAALRVIEVLLERGAQTAYYDPYVMHVSVGGRVLASEPDLDARGFDCVVITTPHKMTDFDRLLAGSGFVLDTVNVLPANFPADIVKL